MTVSVQTTYATYTGNGVTTVFAYQFKILNQTDLTVYVAGVAQVLGVNYTVSGVGVDTGGSITFITGAPAAAAAVSIVRTMQAKRTVDYQHAGDFQSDTVNPDMDNPVLLIQDLQTQIGRSIRTPADEVGTLPVLPSIANRAGKYIAFDAFGQPIGSAGTGTDTALRTDLAVTTLASAGSKLIGWISSAVGAVARSVWSKLNDAVTPYDFGAVLDGAADDTAAVQAFFNAAGALSWPGNKVAKITSQITLSSNTSVWFGAGGGITPTFSNASALKATTKTNIKIRGGTFTQGGASATADIGLIHLLDCDNCDIENNSFVNAQWAGVHLDGTTRDCNVLGNRFTGATTNTNPTGDAMDIAVYRNASNNRVAFNRCYTVNGFGIVVQDPGGLGTFLPQKNKVHNNWVRSKTEHGIIVYIGSATTTDSNNEVFENDVQDISGAANPAVYGVGIYVVGFGACGTKIVGNNVRNACSATAAPINNQAGITINGLPATGAPVICSGNGVSGQTKYQSICIASNLGCHVLATGNTVNHPTGNVTGEAVKIQDSLNTSFNDNTIAVSTASGRRGIYCPASVAVTGIEICDNRVIGGGDRNIETALIGGSITGVRIAGNQCRGAAAGIIPMYLAGLDEADVSGNQCNGTTYAMYVSACTRTRVNGNILKTSGTFSFGSGGLCTGSYFGESNYINGVIENAATGLIANQFASAAPIAPSIGAVGDRVIQSVPVVGNPKGWRCDTAGTPGTWRSEGNL